MIADKITGLSGLQRLYLEKFVPEDYIFSHIHRGDRIFIGTGCGEPQYLVRSLIKYVEEHPKAFFDAEILHVWTLGVAPYTDEKFKYNFRHNSFFVGNDTRSAVNKGLADYTPIFLSGVPSLFYKKLVPIDVALIQTSPPDRHGYMSLGVSVDIVKAAVESARLVVAQVNTNMPRIHGDGFIHIKDINFAVLADEPLLQYDGDTDCEIIQSIGKYVSALIQDGDTIQVGYGGIPSAVIKNLAGKQHLGVHTELLSDGLVELIKSGVVDNSLKNVNRGKTVASFCMGKKETYDFLNDNPSIEFRTIDYTNNPMTIAAHDNMVAINSSLEIDLTGQASAESLGKVFYSGIGGQADFMRGAVLSKNGKTILMLQSTAENDTISRIVPYLHEGAGVTLNRGDVRYVVTEYGIAYLHGRNVRERAMELISIAHPKFRQWLIAEAKKLHLIYHDQLFLPGEKGRYPEEFEAYRTTGSGMEVFLRPVKISDEALLKHFFYSLSENTLYKRFISYRKDMPHERLQEFSVIDYTGKMVILALGKEGGVEAIAGLGQYTTGQTAHVSEVALVVGDGFQGKGIGRQLLTHLTFIAKKQGLLGFVAEVLAENRPMLTLFGKISEEMDFDVEKHNEEGMWNLKMMFKR